jgi:hypothetical protein
MSDMKMAKMARTVHELLAARAMRYERLSDEALTLAFILGGASVSDMTEAQAEARLRVIMQQNNLREVG